MTGTSIRPCLLSDLYHILSAPRRCYVIQILSNTENEEYTTRDLSEKITAIEHDISKKDATGEPYRNVYNALSQTHLETMANADLIEYDHQRQRVKPKRNLKLAALIVDHNIMIYLILNLLETILDPQSIDN